MQASWVWCSGKSSHCLRCSWWPTSPPLMLAGRVGPSLQEPIALISKQCASCCSNAGDRPAQYAGFLLHGTAITGDGSDGHLSSLPGQAVAGHRKAAREALILRTRPRAYKVYLDDSGVQEVSCTARPVVRNLITGWWDTARSYTMPSVNSCTGARPSQERKDLPLQCRGRPWDS
ncbi:uncharacterized protein B0I36DRAFT_312781 [Microdochium trichocladiopsis]|uniref:Uncharacterized protein n=1 Tax=Microdochium trichocladiopsis TaxID=1682393 RepID=A0A9P9BUW7_9PEZI|nr:uncharacterized protein B0I36DRAFT_312781 [Microdochium trichocladiopsis]KAH7041411.1 hypothetical protein B0I36DRAFT_312781 [Microdochium trichocladiopsis]